ncbi:MAG: helix-turn-helix domain-containing protein [Spirochaetaceae bacterium]|nr:helix-turn-helix domain-containing protein [Spirochaetaceae bacterium]
MNVKSIFGENLKLYRKAKKLSQEQLSEKVNISVKHLSSIERGLNFVSADLLEKLAASLGTPAFCFFVDKKEVFYNDIMLNKIDGIVENHLIETIEKIKSAIRRNDK